MAVGQRGMVLFWISHIAREQLSTSPWTGWTLDRATDAKAGGSWSLYHDCALKKGSSWVGDARKLNGRHAVVHQSAGLPEYRGKG